jgi:hypothetical protein
MLNQQNDSASAVMHICQAGGCHASCLVTADIFRSVGALRPDCTPAKLSRQASHTPSPSKQQLSITSAENVIRYVHKMCTVCRSDHTHEEKESTIEELVREITALWQTDELRRKKPSALDGESALHVLMCAHVVHHLKVGVNFTATHTTPVYS